MNTQQTGSANPSLNNLFQRAHDCLMQESPADKSALASSLYLSWLAGELDTSGISAPDRIAVPGRPLAPELVHPGKVPKRSIHTHKGLLCLAHAIAHIEFNAINLALDAVYRFREMPVAFYTDWLRVAAEEARHFAMLERYLQSHGSYYGALAAHNGLWEMALKTDHDVLVRMALVPRVLEARGLDVTPGMIVKLRSVNEHALAAILGEIHREEIGHVLAGTRWFNHICAQRGLLPAETFRRLLDQYMQGLPHGPFDMPSRLQAGFTADELHDLITSGQTVKSCA
jgi:uncharacterized ferritin-like protein (DUF455 family)